MAAVLLGPATLRNLLRFDDMEVIAEATHGQEAIRVKLRVVIITRPEAFLRSSKDATCLLTSEDEQA